MTTQQFHERVLEELKTYSTEKVDQYFEHLQFGDGRQKSYYNEIYRKLDFPCLYYQYLACTARIVKAKQAVELGADIGVSALMLASETDGKVYSVDNRECWSLVPDEHPNIVKYLGDSTTLTLYKGIDLQKTDVWLIDSDHSGPRFEKECQTYRPFWKKGAVVIADDVDQYRNAWDILEGDRLYIPRDIHGNGVGVLIV